MSVDAAKVAEKYERDGEDGLNAEEKRFLQDRGVKLQDPIPVTFKSGGMTVTNDPMAIYSNMQEQQKVDMEAEIEKRVETRLAQLAEQELRNVQHQQIVAETPHTGTANHNVHPSGTPINPSPADLEDDEDDDEEGEEEDYDEGWNNEERRAELAKRKLSVDGNKEALIARLKRSDNDELEDDDKA